MKENIGVKQSNVSKPDHPICSLGDFITGGKVGETGWLFSAYCPSLSSATPKRSSGGFGRYHLQHKDQLPALSLFSLSLGTILTTSTMSQ